MTRFGAVLFESPLSSFDKVRIAPICFIGVSKQGEDCFTNLRQRPATERQPRDAGAIRAGLAAPAFMALPPALSADQLKSVA
jgi:hypothetical protein